MDIKKILFRTNTIDVEKALPDAIIYCAKDGKIQWVNDKTAEVFSTSKMHLLTSNISDFIENALHMISTALDNSNYLIVKVKTEDKFFDMSVKEIDEGYVLSLRNALDGSQYKKALNTAENEVVNRDKNNFLLKLTNDFKSPLQSIVGFSQAMSDGLGGEMSEQQAKYINIIRKNSSDLMYFITKFLELSQTEYEVPVSNCKKFDIVNGLNALIKFNEQLYKHKDVKWALSIDSNIKNTISSDEEMIKTVLQNVIEVILKSIDMGEVSLNLTLPDEEFLRAKDLDTNKSYLHFSISSSSLLLTENDLESMFDPYKIVDTTNRKNILRAIMLANVKNLVKALDGQIWVETQILKNTCFNILIPNCEN